MKPIDVFHKLAGLGLSVEEAVSITDQMLAGQSLAKKQATGWITAASNVATPLVALAGLAPLAAGYAGGSVLADQLDTQPGDIEAIQEQELIKELRANAQAALRRRALRGEEEKKK